MTFKGDKLQQISNDLSVKLDEYIEYPSSLVNGLKEEQLKSFADNFKIGDSVYVHSGQGGLGWVGIVTGTTWVDLDSRRGLVYIVSSPEDKKERLCLPEELELASPVASPDGSADWVRRADMFQSFCSREDLRFYVGKFCTVSFKDGSPCEGYFCLSRLEEYIAGVWCTEECRVYHFYFGNIATISTTAECATTSEAIGASTRDWILDPKELVQDEGEPVIKAHVSVNSELEKKAVEDEELKGSPFFSVGDVVRVANYESQPGYPLIGDGERLVGKPGMVEQLRYAEDGVTKIARVNICDMGTWYLPLSCLEHSAMPIEDEVSQKLENCLDTANDYPTGTINSFGRELSVMNKMSEEALRQLGETAKMVVGEIGARSAGGLLVNYFVYEGGTVYITIMNNSEEKVGGDLLENIKRYISKGPLGYAQVFVNESPVNEIYDYQGIPVKIVDNKVLKMQEDYLYSLGHKLEALGIPEEFLYNASGVAPAGTFKDPSRVTLEEVAEAINDGKLPCFGEGVSAKVTDNERIQLHPPLVGVTGIYSCEGLTDTRLEEVMQRKDVVDDLKQKSEEASKYKSGVEDLVIESMEFKYKPAETLKPVVQTTCSMELEFADGLHITVPSPGAGWVEKETHYLDRPHRYAHTVELHKNAVDLIYADLSCRGSSWDRRLGVRHESGRCFLYEYAKRIEAGYTRIISWTEWEREV